MVGRDLTVSHEMDGNLNISPERSHSELQCDSVVLQNYVLMIFVMKDLVIKKEPYLCQTLYIIK